MESEDKKYPLTALDTPDCPPHLFDIDGESIDGNKKIGVCRKCHTPGVFIDRIPDMEYGDGCSGTYGRGEYLGFKRGIKGLKNKKLFADD